MRITPRPRWKAESLVELEWEAEEGWWEKEVATPYAPPTRNAEDALGLADETLVGLAWLWDGRRAGMAWRRGPAVRVATPARAQGKALVDVVLCWLEVQARSGRILEIDPGTARCGRNYLGEGGGTAGRAGR